MDTKFYTSVEQSKHLLSLGINSESADMFYQWIADCKLVNIGDIPYEDKGCCIPCWSTARLFDFMPIGSKLLKNNAGMFICKSSGHTEIMSSSIDACYNMVVWLLENNYIKKVE